ncbi:ATP-binding protein [Arenibacterium sp. LLYu02]|uniref:ATP-binding protein n=1 Tax=Arenibacterium sp. LLYu02 TaxID=3404132 RepID=UPI003B215C1C
MTRLSISRKAALVVAAIGVLTGILFGLKTFRQSAEDTLFESRRYTDMVLQATQPQLTGAYWQVDLDEVHRILRGLLEVPSIAAAQIDDPMLPASNYARDSVSVARAEDEPASSIIRWMFGEARLTETRRLDLISPRDGTSIGALEVRLDFAPILNGLVPKGSAAFLGSVLQALLVATAIFIVLQFTVIFPVSRLHDAIARMKSGQPFQLQGRAAAMLDHRRSDEISRLAQAFQQSVTALEQYSRTLEDRVHQRTRELVVARNQALEASRIKSDFLANMSHELRTPLNAISGITELLIREHRAEGARQHLTDLRESARLLSDNIEAVLNQSKIEAGQMTLDMQWCDLSEVLDRTMSQGRALSRGKPVQLVSDYPPDLPCRIWTDPTRLTQILTNFMSNAVKFTPAGTVHLSVRVTNAGPARKTLSFAVQDEGAGISEEQRALIFVPFMQIATPGREQSGTGLGLSIAQGLAALMGGRIEVASASGGGAIFTLTAAFDCDDRIENGVARRIYLDPAIPQQQQLHGMCGRIGMTVVPMAGTSDLQLLPSGPSGPGFIMRATSSGRRLTLDLPLTHRDMLDAALELTNTTTVEDLFIGQRILVVEDNLVGRRVLAELVRGFGCDVRTARHGAQMLDLLQDWTPDLIIMDLQMPVMTGHQALAALKQTYGTRHPPVVATSANADAVTVKQCKAEGFVDFLAKPVVPGRIIEVLKPLLDAAPRALIDREAGLLYCNDDAGLYQQTLRDFQKDLDRWLSALDCADTASTALHQIKGAASTIGARHLAALAASEPPDIRSVARVLSFVGEEIARTSAPGDAAHVPQQLAAGPEGTEDEALDRLHRQLMEHDVAAVDTLASLITQAALPERYDALSEALERLDFSTAQRCLVAIKRAGSA